MTFTYNIAALNEPLNKVRKLVRDAREDDPLLQDEDILDYLTDERGNIYMAAAAACEGIALELGRGMDVKGETGFEAKSKYDQYKHMAT